ncbi:MAG: hypothetical protein ACRC42_04570 [Mycoplasma sp.]
MKENNSCPMCREKIDINWDDSFVNDLLRVQRRIHPAFAILAFNSLNDEFSWGIDDDHHLEQKLAVMALGFK